MRSSSYNGARLLQDFICEEKDFQSYRGAKDEKLIYIFIVPFGTLVAAF